MVEVTITDFQMGQDVPEWLITFEPMSAAAQRGKVRWGRDMRLVDLPDSYVVWPLVPEQAGPLIDASGTTHCKVFASSKTVVMSVAAQWWQPENDPHWRETYLLGEASQPMPQAVVRPAQRLTAAERAAEVVRGRRGWWQWLLDGLSG